MDINDAISDYILDCRIRDLSKNSIETYSSHLKKFKNFLEKNSEMEAVKNIEKMRKAQVTRFILAMQEEQLNNNYINIIIKTLRNFFRIYETRRQSSRAQWIK